MVRLHIFVRWQIEKGETFKRMKKIVTIIASLALMATLMACGGGDTEISEEKIETFAEDGDMYVLVLKNVQCSSDSNVAGTLTIAAPDGESELCTVSGSDSGLISVETDEAGKTITVKAKRNVAPDSVSIFVSANVREINASKCRLRLDAALDYAQEVDLILSGTFYGNIHMAANKLSAELKGAGNLELLGSAADTRIALDGAALLDASMLYAGHANVTVKGAAACEVYVSDTLDAALYGVGRILYFGEPKTVNKSVKGLGMIYAG